ncbi:MAG: PAS domain S-box protein [Nitrospirae bacterium]|nr:PAS domain S-box protein [Nitrospirota bacterium]
MRHIHETSSRGIGEPAEFVWGRRESADIVFLLHSQLSNVKSVPFDSKLAEPMRRALNGQTGTVVGLDYRGEKVFSAYAPLNALGRHSGIVTKTALSKVREPFIRVGGIACFVGIMAILTGAFAFYRITNPILRKIQESENMFRCLVEKSLSGIYIIRDKRFVYVNPRFAEIFGYGRPEELIGKSPLELIYADDNDKASEILHKHFSTDVASENFCLQCVKKDNGIVQIEIQASRAKIDNAPSIIGMLQDITRRVEEENSVRQLEIAREASRAKTQFLSMAAHELRSPLSGISGFAQTLRQACENNWLSKEMLPDYIGKILNSVYYMSSLIEGLLEFSNIESGKIDIEYEAINLRRVLEITESNMIDKVKDKELELSLEIPPELPLIRAGLKQLTQILFNLIGNSVKFVPDKGRITVRAKVEDSSILITVGDSGPGMDEDTLKHIFEVFWRSNKVKDISGTGLGLAITKSLVETMGGRIWVKSEQGVGSTFYFTVQQWRDNGEK